MEIPAQGNGLLLCRGELGGWAVEMVRAKVLMVVAVDWRRGVV
mgnify:CR=1 FL=1